jgi:4-hydroxythreonine-4-phosphate dehydrogenase
LPLLILPLSRRRKIVLDSNQVKRPKVAVIMGDATGIGPEIVAKAMNTEETRRLCIPAVVGDARVMAEAIKLTKVPLKIVIRKTWGEVTGESGLMEMFDLANLDPQEYKVGEVSPRAGKACLEYLEWTIPQVQAGQAAAMVFAPLNKQAMRLAGSPYKGELEHFAHLTQTELFGEINVLDPLWTSRVTSHIGFREICSQLTVDRILRAVTLLHRAMLQGGIENPRIGVAALNPHAGEKGLFGPEEESIIKPAVERARQEGMDIKGPFPADTIFVRARKDEFLGVVTMYHDQGQIATKLLGFDRGVTVAGGFPIAIATPAHGTAHDIAGKGIADIGAFQAAIRVAVRMASGHS